MAYQGRSDFRGISGASSWRITEPEEGLLILNPNTPDLKKQAAHLFRKEIETAPYLSDSIQEVSKEIRKLGYHAQLDLQGMNLFIADEGKRYKLSKVGDGFSYNSIPLSTVEIQAILTDHPERFSMNVVMRPLVQDFVLPTVAYVAGPGEIAYFAQLKTAYDWAGIHMPLIVPRISLTLVEDRFVKLLDKYKIPIEALLEKGEEIITKLLSTEQEKILSDSFSEAGKKIEADLEALRNVISLTDATLDPALTSVKGKILTALKDFESKSLATERKKQSGTKQQFQKSAKCLTAVWKASRARIKFTLFSE